MISYDYFYRERLPLDRPCKRNWDLFISAWDGSERVRHILGLVSAPLKISLVHPEYELPEAAFPGGERFELRGDEADGILAFVEHLKKLHVDLTEAKLGIDITGMIRPHIALLTKMLRAQGVQQFDVIYSEPVSYADRENTKFTSGDVIEVREIIGFEGRNTITNSREVLILAPGFDDALLREIVSHKEHATKVEIFGLPSLQADMYQHNVLKALGPDTPLPEETSDIRHFAAAWDPFAMAGELSAIIAQHKRRDANTRFYIAALATKVQTLGAAIFYLTECEDSAVSLLYPFASAHFPGPSVGISRAWVFQIDFRLCEALSRASLH
jgi:hypothetical protein